MLLIHPSHENEKTTLYPCSHALMAASHLFLHHQLIENILIMKRLVKTALQQFNEDLSQIQVDFQYNPFEDEQYFGGRDSDGNFVLMRNIKDTELDKVRYGQTYGNLVLSDDFLQEISSSFAERQVSLIPLFKWYASADHEEEPFDLFDIYNLNLASEVHTQYEDIYKEVPDTKIISAREQWERDSAEAASTQFVENLIMYRIVSRANGIYFYSCHPNGTDADYKLEIYPSLEKLRRDSTFVVSYLAHVKKTHPDDLDASMDWLTTGKYTMAPCSMMDIHDIIKPQNYYTYKELEYSSHINIEFGEQIQQLRDKLVDRISVLSLGGLSVNLNKLFNHYNIVWEDGAYNLTENIKTFRVFYSDKDEVWEYEYGEHRSNEEYTGPLCILSIETLRNIINSMD